MGRQMQEQTDADALKLVIFVMTLACSAQALGLVEVVVSRVAPMAELGVC